MSDAFTPEHFGGGPSEWRCWWACYGDSSVNQELFWREITMLLNLIEKRDY